RHEARLGAPRERGGGSAERAGLHPRRGFRHPDPRPVPDAVRWRGRAPPPDHAPGDRTSAQGRGPLQRRGRQGPPPAAHRPEPAGPSGPARIPAWLGPVGEHRHQPAVGADPAPWLLQLRDPDRRPAGAHPAVPRGESSPGPDRLTDALTSFVVSYGLLAVFVLMVVESCGVPFPSEVTMPVAGVLAAAGHLNLAAVIVTGAFANLVGSLIAYWLAARFGEPLLLGPGRYVGIRRHHLEIADGWFRRWGL